MYTADSDILAYITVAASIQVFTYLPGLALRCYSELSAHPGRLLSVALAVFRFAGSHRLRELQTDGMRTGQETESGVEPMV